ncbi:MAG: glycosyltransferase, partial [Bacteroidota bacterium]
MNIAVLSNTSWSIFNFRRHLIHSLKDQGHRVVAIAPEDEYSETINSWTTFIPLRGMQANRKNPFADAVLARNIRKIFLAEKIDLVFSFTPKGNIYSAFAAQTCRAICVPTVNGLGTGFEKRGLLSRVLIQLYKQSFRKCRTVFFQNPDDALLFQKKRILKASSVKLVNGSGVDLTKF